MFLLWDKVSPLIWWALAVILALMFIGARTYRTAVSDGSDLAVVKFWHTARTLIFLADIIIVCALYLFIFFA